MSLHLTAIKNLNREWCFFNLHSFCIILFFPRFFPEMGFRMPIKPCKPPQKTIAWLSNNCINMMIWKLLISRLVSLDQSRARPAQRPLLGTINPFEEPNLYFTISIRHFLFLFQKGKLIWDSSAAYSHEVQKLSGGSQFPGSSNIVNSLLPVVWP